MGYIKLFNEDKDDDIVKNVIKDLIDTEWSKMDDKSKAVNLFKGLIYSDSKIAKKFIKDLDKLTSGMNIKDYK